MNCVVMCAVLLLPAQTEMNPRDVIAAARRSSANIAAYRAHTRIVTETLVEADPPARPAELRSPVPEEYAIPEAFEDRFDRRLGRSRLRFLDHRPFPSSAEFLELSDSAVPLNDLKFRDSPDDLLWVLNPTFGDFQILDVLESHPDVRLRRSKNLYVVEIPAKALVSGWEFGARVLIDPKRNHALTGVDVYNSNNGSEILIQRTDVEFKRVKGPAKWFPSTVVSWKRLSSPTDVTTHIGAQLTEVTLNSRKSAFDGSLRPQDIQLADWQGNEVQRLSLSGGWTEILYRPIAQRKLLGLSDIRIGLILLNALVVAMLVAALIWRKRSRNASLG